MIGLIDLNRLQRLTLLLRVCIALLIAHGAFQPLTAAADTPSKVITFEDGSLVHPVTGVTRVAGNVVLDNTSLIKGIYSARIPGANSSYLQEDFAGADEVYVSFYLKLDALPADSMRIAQILNDGMTVGNLYLHTNGALRLRSGTTTIGADTAPLEVGPIYHLAMRQRRGTGGDAILEGYLAADDAPLGTPFASITTGNWTSQAQQVRLGATNSAALNATYDDIQLYFEATSGAGQPSATPASVNTPDSPTATSAAPTATQVSPTATQVSPTSTPAQPTPTPSELSLSSTSGTGIWISREGIMKLPTSGSEWQALYNTASGSLGTANIADQDSKHDVNTLAASLVCVRTGQFCDKARAAVVSAIGTEEGGRWLAVGRNLTSYVISADLLNLRADSNPNSDGSRVEAWIRSFLTKKLRHNNDASRLIGFPVFESGSNASAEQGAAYAAVAAYLGNHSALEYAWNRFRLYSCDRSSPESEINITKGVEGGWAHDKNNPCAVNPAGTSRDGHRIDGAIINDMVRGGSYQWSPGYTQYPWVGLEGYVPAAYILYRAGYPAFELENRAVLRTLEYLKYLDDNTSSDWFDGSRANEIVHLVNVIYGTNFPMKGPTGGGRTVGFTGWTHPRSGGTQP